MKGVSSTQSRCHKGHVPRATLGHVPVADPQPARASLSLSNTSQQPETVRLAKRQLTHKTLFTWSTGYRGHDMMKDNELFTQDTNDPQPRPLSPELPSLHFPTRGTDFVVQPESQIKLLRGQAGSFVLWTACESLPTHFSGCVTSSHPDFLEGEGCSLPPSHPMVLSAAACLVS